MRVAVAGLGWWGKQIVSCLSRSRRFEVLYGIDPKPPADVEDFRKTYPFKLSTDLGVALAITAGAQAVAYGAHAGDHFIYPDCRPGFVTAYQQMALAANDGFLPAGFTVAAPFITMTKAGIAALAARLSVPIGQTWSCYRGGQLHCGTCGTCTERREALALAGVPDPTEYAAG